MWSILKIFTNLILLVRLLTMVAQVDGSYVAIRTKVEPYVSTGIIRFNLNLPYESKPTRMLVQVTKPRRSEPIDFEVVGTKNPQTITFQNTQPQIFFINDVLEVTLDNVYGSNRIKFNYTIQNKPSTFLYIKKLDLYSLKPMQSNTDVEVDFIVDHVPLLSNNSNELNQNISKSADQVFNGKHQKFLRTALDIALTDGHFNNKLLLSKISEEKVLVDAKQSAIDIVRKVIRQDLKIPTLEYQILNVAVIDEGIVFEMASAKDSLEILTQFQLLGSNTFNISRTDYDFYAPRLDVRSNR
ncbi:uncharacterized protein LOC119662427 [Teleopsis dalmanni]|uniref:uncharacterized protein LOC119662427 n=1 Tax=Teleopsis dalmanni TaxID=139649 RepID=UPI0018CD2F84|nr:uncharacterized protein LOC119662427 [Teleopsis dalmanni]